ncbi:MAG TPA: hypothetical protein ENN80_02000, partial [Candidatus Hydrogenedentes bacterium]|nr:hypothetical protein [Candidatus Hydrogenedentota bacterium]
MSGRAHVSWKARALLGAVVLLLVASALEGGARIAVRSKEQAFMLSPHVQLNNLQRYDPVLMWSLKPNVRDTWSVSGLDGGIREALVTTNALGLRNPPIEAKDLRVRILAIGDSTTFGPKLSDDETWPARFQSILDAKEPGVYDVINASVSGYSACQGLRYLNARGFDLEPDVVIACFAHNDSCGVEANGLGDLEWYTPAPIAFVTLLREAMMGAGRLAAPRTLGERAERLSLGEFLDTLVHMAEVCKNHNAQLIHVLWPYRSEARALPEPQQPRSLVIEAGKATLTPVINLFDLVKYSEEELYLYEDDLH